MSGNFQTSPPTPQKSYPKFHNPTTTFALALAVESSKYNIYEGNTSETAIKMRTLIFLVDELHIVYIYILIKLSEKVGVILEKKYEDLANSDNCVLEGLFQNISVLIKNNRNY